MYCDFSMPALLRFRRRIHQHIATEMSEKIAPMGILAIAPADMLFLCGSKERVNALVMSARSLKAFGRHV
jgi:hypothetical protein